jgi:hypothetical protein
MPIHDWSRVPSGLFHHFQQDWSIEIARALNRGRLSEGLSAIVEQRVGPPLTSIVRQSTRETYADRSNRVVVKHHLGRTVAVVEIVSPVNKDCRAIMGDFVDKSLDFMRRGVHLLLVDLFPPTPRDPFGMHKAIWDEITDEPFAFPPGTDRILASYEMGPERAAYVEPVGVGDRLAAMPLFLTPGAHVRVPLEPTYQATWDASPEELRTAVETGVMPDPDAEE